jgi:hypothetical protein|tara:strand:- start:18 stop:722 length:705 start_codon:yes stop_codon:yes gene_type:complete
MEPQVIDYYNEMPHGINVMAKLDEEYEEAMDRIKQLEAELSIYKDKLNRFKVPKIKVSSVEEYEIYERAIELFEENVGMLLEDEDNLSLKLYGDMNYDGIHGMETPSLVDKIIEELNKLTEYQNEEWSRFRVLQACEVSGCAIPVDKVNSEIILGNIMLSGCEGYTITHSLEGITESHKFPVCWPDDEGRTLNLYTLCHYTCEKCGKEGDYGELYDREGTKLDILLCGVCWDLN